LSPFRFLASHHVRSEISTQVLEYYGIKGNNNDKVTSSVLKREAEYEAKLVSKLEESIIFCEEYPDKLCTFVNHDIAPPAIEHSLLNAKALGHQAILEFVNKRLVAAEGKTESAVRFDAPMKRINAPTFNNLFDVERKNEMNEKQVVSLNRKVLQNFISSYQAGRSVDFEEAAKYEVLSIPISLFNTDKTMRTGQKSDILGCILEYTGQIEVEFPNDVPSFDSLHVIDVMAYVNLLKLKPDLETYGDLADSLADSLLHVHSDTIHSCGDRYHKTSTKDGCRTKRSKGKKRKAVEKVICSETPLPKTNKQLKETLSIKENKKYFQKLFGERMLQRTQEKAPNKAAAVSGIWITVVKY
jgi:hypothetical protein